MITFLDNHYLSLPLLRGLWTLGDPCEIRTRVAGVRGRSLRPLDQRATLMADSDFIKDALVGIPAVLQIGTPSRARTVDTLIKSQVLYQLS